MVRTARLLIARQRPLEERFRFGVARLLLIHDAKLDQRLPDLATLSGPSVFSLIASARLIQRLGFGVARLSDVERRQIAQRLGDVLMVRPERLLVDRERPLVERLGIREAALDLDKATPEW